MDAGVRQKRVEALEKIKENALERAKRGDDSFPYSTYIRMCIEKKERRGGTFY
jgi:predicted DNA binding CopG/RHH family protein